MGKKTSKKAEEIKKTVDVWESPSLITDFDIHLFRSGKHFRLHEKLGAHPMVYKGERGTYFAVWAPNAQAVSVIG
ncbi:MAG TPA: 1,4-alpha-glucan branching enzyme, partial [Cytophagales bacterium]|nr:1,4-alpha-glucan branching enzyme [Cytophagales bacterium]